MTLETYIAALEALQANDKYSANYVGGLGKAIELAREHFGWKPIESAPKDKAIRAKIVVKFSDGTQAIYYDALYWHKTNTWLRDKDSNPILIFEDEGATITHWDWSDKFPTPPKDSV